jgi:glycosyltransferase involved in cell wall biosynthesis
MKKMTDNKENALSGSLFSIIIPTWNNLEMLTGCIDSIFKNSNFKHQIILHVNEGGDGTREWAEENGLEYSFSEKNIGVCDALNLAAKKAATDYILYMNDDMYVCPEWDLHLWEEVKKQPDHLFFISATAIEPSDVGKKTAIAPYNFGLAWREFDEKGLLEQYKNLPMLDWSGSSWPPNVVHRSIWEKAGGYSPEFYPGFYSDPDFSMKLWQLGVRRFQGVASSRVYHFLESSTKKFKNEAVKKGRGLFLKKWGITSRVFYTYYLRMGQPYTGDLKKPSGLMFYWELFLCKLKRL